MQRRFLAVVQQGDLDAIKNFSGEITPEEFNKARAFIEKECRRGLTTAAASIRTFNAPNLPRSKAEKIRIILLKTFSQTEVSDDEMCVSQPPAGFRKN